MLKDWLFYPLALILILGLIGYELTRSQDSDFVLSDVCQNGYAFKGEDLKYLVASPGTTTQYMQARHYRSCLLYTSPSPRDKRQSRMPSSA